MRVWFNKTFSSVHAALRLIREGDVDRRYELVASSPNPHALVQLASHEFHTEPSQVSGAAYVDWCEAFCAQHDIGIFIPGKDRANIKRTDSNEMAAMLVKLGSIMLA